MDDAVVALERTQEGIDALLGIAERLRHVFPLIVVEYQKAAVHDQWPGQYAVAVDIDGAVAAVDIGDVESPSVEAKLCERRRRRRLDLLDAVLERRDVGVETLLDLGQVVRDRIGVGLMLLATGERV